MQKSSRLCENSEFAEKWLVSTEFLRFVEPVTDENRRKSAEIHQLAHGRVSFHTVCKIYATVSRRYAARKLVYLLAEEWTSAI